ncbi:MAG: acyltransferase family protein [Pseudomonadota bacterium]
MTDQASDRIGWVDVSKGICILLVVMFHATQHLTPVVGAGGLFDSLTRFSGPFRMPDFFLISGLFLSRRITAPLGVYLDRKVLHFAYFYWLWMFLTFAVLTPGLGQGLGPFLADFGWAMIYPTGPLWFIYCLPLCFVIARLAYPLPTLVVWLGAAVAHVLHVPGEPLVLMYLSHYFVFFYTGYAAAPALFRLAARASEQALLAVGALGLWAALNGWIVFAEPGGFPGLGLILGLAGGIAVTVVAALLAKAGIGRALAWLGARSIIVFLGFFIPLRVAEAYLLAVPGLPGDAVIGLSIAAAVAAPLFLETLLRRTGGGLWLFERPAWARWRPRRSQAA